MERLKCRKELRSRKVRECRRIVYIGILFLRKIRVAKYRYMFYNIAKKKNKRKMYFSAWWECGYKKKFPDMEIRVMYTLLKLREDCSIYINSQDFPFPFFFFFFNLRIGRVLLRNENFTRFAVRLGPFYCTQFQQGGGAQKRLDELEITWITRLCSVQSRSPVCIGSWRGRGSQVCPNKACRLPERKFPFIICR